MRQKNVKNVNCKVFLKTKALQNNLCFGKASSSEVTSTTRETQKQQLNSVYNKFSYHTASLIVIFDYDKFNCYLR